MEKEYQKIIHHTSTLILAGHYRRASNILAHIMEQGLCNSEVLVLLSYCTKMMKGINAAILVLEGSGDRGPLVLGALGQYYREVGEKGKCLGVFREVEGEKQSNGKPSDISQICQNLQISLEPSTKPPAYTHSHPQINHQIINELNTIVQSYKSQQSLPQQTKQSLKTLLLEHQPEGKLKQIISRFIKFLQCQPMGSTYQGLGDYL